MSIVPEHLRKDLISIKNVKMQNLQFPRVTDNRLYIIGGSLNNVYDQFGVEFLKQFVIPLLKKIQNGDPVVAYGACFGHQALLGAYGSLFDIPIQTHKGALAFGPFPVQFKNSHHSLRFLAQRTCTVVMTRSGYAILPSNYREYKDIIPLAFECQPPVDGSFVADKKLPPVAFSLMNGSVLTSQFHPEMILQKPHHRGLLRDFIFQARSSLEDSFAAPVDGSSFELSQSYEDVSKEVSFVRKLSKLDRCLHGNIPYTETALSDREPGIPHDIAGAYLFPTFQYLAQKLLAQIKSSASR